MTEILLAYGGLLLFLLVLLALRILAERKSPTHLKDSRKGRLPDDARHGSGHYLYSHFTKIKNGRYRLKYSALDRILTVIVYGGFSALYIWLLYTEADGILKYPEVAVGYALLGLALVLLAVLLMFPRISAKIYFRKISKELFY